MSNLNESMRLEAEMAAISAVSSEEIVKNVRDTAQLSKFQDKLEESKDRVEVIKEVLVNTEPHDVTVELATTIDRILMRSDVDIPAEEEDGEVAGVEALGLTLLPSTYLMTRRMGCENFLSDFFKRSKEVTARIAMQFKEVYILFTQTQDTLEQQLEELERLLDATPKFEGKENIILGSRLFNLFKINGGVNNDWSGNLSKLSRTVTGISTNYYLNSKNTLNTSLSYFGGFSEATDGEAMDRFLMMPISIPSERFKECTYPNKTFSLNNATAKQSVELMGGAYFVDVRLNASRKKAQTVDEVEEYLDRHIEQEYTGFENSAEIIFPKFGNEIKSLSHAQIKVVIQHLRNIIKEWRKVFEGGEKYKLADADYQDIVKGIYESAMSDEMKDRVVTAFQAIVKKNQMELLNIRAAVNTYLVLIVNGLIELSYTSIKANSQ